MSIKFIFILTLVLSSSAICCEAFDDDLSNPKVTRYYPIVLVIQNHAHNSPTTLAIDINCNEYRRSYPVSSQLGIQTCELPTDYIKTIEISHFGVEDDATANFNFFSYTRFEIEGLILFMTIELYENTIKITYERNLPPKFDGTPSYLRISYSAISSNKNS